MPGKESIDDFFNQTRLAVVGVSRDGKAFANTIFRELRGRGYDVVPVNPGASELEGARCYARLQEISPPVEGAIVYVPAEAAEAVARDCREAGVTRIWFAGPGKAGKALAPALAYCRAEGLEAIGGWCPYMFLPNTSFPHRLHAFFARLFGTRPK